MRAGAHDKTMFRVGKKELREKAKPEEARSPDLGVETVDSLVSWCRWRGERVEKSLD